MGGTDPSLYTGNFGYTPIVPGEGFYSINMTDILVDGKSIGQPYSSYSSNAIVDSGTNILLLPDELYGPLDSTFQSLCSKINLPYICKTKKSFFDGYCYPLTQQQIDEFPSIELNIDGVPLIMSGEDYLLEEQPGSNNYCLAILNTGPGGFIIIGDTVMQNYYTLFDVTNQRLGWATVNSGNCFN